jgi:hypothetical protein
MCVDHTREYSNTIYRQQRSSCFRDWQVFRSLLKYENLESEYHARGRWELMLLELIVLLVRSGQRLKWLLLAERSVAGD